MNFQASELLSAAARQVCKSLGVERVAEIARRSAAMVYKWSDATHSYFPNLLQAFQLDAEFVRRGLGAPPFLSAYASALRHLPPAGKLQQGEPISDAVKMVNLASKILVELTGHATSDLPYSTAAYRRAVCHNLRELDQMVVSLRWRLEADLVSQERVQSLRSAEARQH